METHIPEFNLDQLISNSERESEIVIQNKNITKQMLLESKRESKREYEIVIQNKIIPMQELRERIISIGGKIIQEESIYYHIVYSHPYNKNKNFIRLRNEGIHITLTYKIHNNNKFPVEHEIIVNNLNEANNILKLLGCKYKY